MSIFRITRKKPNPLAGQVDSINLTYTKIKRAFDETAKGREEDLDFVEYTLFLLALALAIHTRFLGKIDIRARNKFIDDHVLETINHVRLELPYHKRPYFFRGSIVHIPDMKNWLGALVVKKMRRYQESFEGEGITAALVPIVRQAERDIFSPDSESFTDEHCKALQMRIETIVENLNGQKQ